MRPSSIRSPLPCGALFPTEPSSLRSPLPCGALFHAEPSSMRSPLPCGALFHAEPSSLRSPLPCGALFPADPSSLRSPLPCGVVFLQSPLQAYSVSEEQPHASPLFSGWRWPGFIAEYKACLDFDRFENLLFFKKSLVLSRSWFAALLWFQFMKAN